MFLVFIATDIVKVMASVRNCTKQIITCIYRAFVFQIFIARSYSTHILIQFVNVLCQQLSVGLMILDVVCLIFIFIMKLISAKLK